MKPYIPFVRQNLLVQHKIYMSITACGAMHVTTIDSSTQFL